MGSDLLCDMVTPLEDCENSTLSGSQTELEVGKQMYCCSSR